jgi:hypothetical protein
MIELSPGEYRPKMTNSTPGKRSVLVKYEFFKFGGLDGPCRQNGAGNFLPMNTATSENT